MFSCYLSSYIDHDGMFLRFVFMFFEICIQICSFFLYFDVILMIGLAIRSNDTFYPINFPE